MKKNVSGQKVGAQLTSATDGSAFTGAVTVSVTIDAGTQGTGSVGAGACTHEGNGYHTYAPAQAETNGDLLAFTFTGTGAITVTLQVYTRFDAHVVQWLDAAVTVNTAGLPRVDVVEWRGGSVQVQTAAGLPNVNAKTWNELTTVELPLVPTTAGRQLDVSAGGEAGVDWANVGSPTTAQNLSGTNIDVDQVVASVSGAVGSVTGAVGSVTGAVGSVAGLTAATVHNDLDDLQTRLPAALVGGRMDSSVGAMAANVLTAAATADGAFNRATFAADTGLQPIRSGTAQAGAAGTITLDASASATNNLYAGAWILLTGGTGAGQVRRIASYVGATKVATIGATSGEAGWITTPDNTTTFAMLPAAPLDTVAVVAAVSVAEVTLGAIGATSFAADGLAAIADAVFDEPTSGHTTAGTYGDKLGAHLPAVLKVIVGAGSSATSIVLNATTGIDGGVPSAVDDFYNGRVLVFTSGTLSGQATSISDYTGSTKTLTVVALTAGPIAAVTAVIV